MAACAKQGVEPCAANLILDQGREGGCGLERKDPEEDSMEGEGEGARGGVAGPPRDPAGGRWGGHEAGVCRCQTVLLHIFPAERQTGILAGTAQTLTRRC